MNQALSPEERESADHALSIMKAWQWVRYNPDGEPLASPLDVATAISRLVYHGHANPKSALLTLFCDGAIQANADYRWAKSLNGQDFRLEGNHATIDPMRWSTLRDALKMHKGDYESGEYSEAVVSLQLLDRTDEPVGSWEPIYDRCSYAICSDGIGPYETGYFEETFTAQHICIFPLAIPGPDGEIVGIADRADNRLAKPISADEAQRGRKPKYDWPAATLAVFGLIYRGELKPEIQADIERALIDHLSHGDNAPSESTVRPYAKLVWEEYSKA